MLVMRGGGRDASLGESFSRVRRKSRSGAGLGVAKDDDAVFRCAQVRCSELLVRTWKIVAFCDAKGSERGRGVFEKAGECNGDGGVSERRSREVDGCWMLVYEM